MHVFECEAGDVGYVEQYKLTSSQPRCRKFKIAESGEKIIGTTESFTRVSSNKRKLPNLITQKSKSF